MTFRLSVVEVFRLEGRTVLAGRVHPERLSSLPTGPCYLLIDGKRCQTFLSEGEWNTESRQRTNLRALSSIDDLALPNDWRQREIIITNSTRVEEDG